MPINSLNNLTNKTSGSISKLFGTNKILNQTIGGALQSGIALVEQFNQIELNASISEIVREDCSGLKK